VNGRRILSALGIWLVLLVVAVTAGALRESLLTPRIGAQASHVVGTLVVAVVMASIIAVYVRRDPMLSLAERWWIGIFWLVLTVGFEFLFGHYAMGHPWERLLADYNLLAGRLWVLILATVLFTPVLAGRSRRGE
jgi:hypothetical protein